MNSQGPKAIRYVRIIIIEINVSCSKKWGILNHMKHVRFCLSLWNIMYELYSIKCDQIFHCWTFNFISNQKPSSNKWWGPELIKWSLIQYRTKCETSLLHMQLPCTYMPTTLPFSFSFNATTNRPGVLYFYICLTFYHMVMVSISIWFWRLINFFIE